MDVTIMQPAYLPWLGFCERVALSDRLIVLDNVAMDGSSRTKFVNRNRVRDSQSWSWLTVPLKSVRRDDKVPINQLEIDNTQRWARKHRLSLERYYPAVEGCLEKPWLRLVDLNQEITKLILEWLELETTVVRASELSAGGAGSDLILNICREVGASRYWSGPFGRDYLDQPSFTEAGIELAYHDYDHPDYRQVYGGFEPYMSVIDLLFNHGSDSLSILKTHSKFRDG